MHLWGFEYFLHRMSELGLPSNFVAKRLLLLRSGYVRELAAASYPHIHCSGGGFLSQLQHHREKLSYGPLQALSGRGKLKRDVATVPDHVGAYIDQLFAQHGSPVPSI
jgi:hypothetical protein